MTTDSYATAYQRGFDLTVRFLRSRGVCGDAATEAAQAAWVRGWERIGQLRNESMVTTWVNSIALNFYRGTLRHSHALVPLPELPGMTGINYAAMDVAKILPLCSSRERQLFSEYLRGLSTREIAKKNGLSETAVRIRFLRARRKVRGRMADLESKTCSAPDVYEENIAA